MRGGYEKSAPGGGAFSGFARPGLVHRDAGDRQLLRGVGHAHDVEALDEAVHRHAPARGALHRAVVDHAAVGGDHHHVIGAVPGDRDADARGVGLDAGDDLVGRAGDRRRRAFAGGVVALAVHRAAGGRIDRGDRAHRGLRVEVRRRRLHAPHVVAGEVLQQAPVVLLPQAVVDGTARGRTGTHIGVAVAGVVVGGKPQAHGTGPGHGTVAGLAGARRIATVGVRIRGLVQADQHLHRAPQHAAVNARGGAAGVVTVVVPLVPQAFPAAVAGGKLAGTAVGRQPLRRGNGRIR